MKITDVMVEKFGVWRDLMLSVHQRGVTVLHGPNEAGKSTLMRFLRSTLYGEHSVSGPAEILKRGWGGSLQFQRGNETGEVTRRTDEQGKSHFQARLGNRPLSERQFEQELLTVDAEVFHSIYSLGLKELRELANLQADEVSEFIYGNSLGSIGQRLLTAENRTRSQMQRLTGADGKSGKLFELSGRYDSLQEAVKKADRVMQNYRDGLEGIDRLERERKHCQQQLDRLQNERDGLEHLQRVWHPWQRQRELRRELAAFDGLRNFPADGLKRLEQEELAVEKARQKVSSLKKRLSQLKNQLAADKEHYELRDHASGIRALIDLKSLIETAERHLADASADATMLKAELDEKLQVTGNPWTIQQLGQVDVSPQAHGQLVSAAKNYQTALTRRARHRKKYQKVSDANHNRQTLLQENLKKRNVHSLDQAVRQAQQKLKELEQLASLRIQESEYEQRIRSAQTMLEKYREGSELPWWASFMLTMFAMAGGFFVIAGFTKGVQTSWVVGAIYVLTGIMAGGLAWSLRQHYETDDHHVHTKLENEIRDCQQKLNGVRDKIAKITGINYNVRAVYRDPQSQKQQYSEADLIRQATQRLVELEELARTDEKIQKTRKKLSVQRGKLSTYQREVSRVRQLWCDLLKKLGLQETVRTNEAFQHWQMAVDADQTLSKWTAAKEDVQRHTHMLNLFREQMQQIAQRMNLKGQFGHSLVQTLHDWQTRIDQFERTRSSYQKHRQEYRDLKRELQLAERDWKNRKSDLQTLLRTGHASTVEEFRLNAERMQRGAELRALLADITDQLNSLAREQSQLAIVEEELARFDTHTTRERLELIELEIEECKQQLEGHHEQLGRQKLMLQQLEEETSIADARCRQQRVVDESRQELQDWLAAGYASDAFAGMTRTLEEKFQPETLARASHYLQKLTCDRYTQVRTPFGSRDLQVTDSHGHQRGSADLSDGTREQLFLAIRLALIDVLAEKQIELPMILDDICVNFDQQRTEAAVDTILEFAERRQVLFFTCHLHLAKIFQDRGIEPTWLPGHSQLEPQRLAG